MWDRGGRGRDAIRGAEKDERRMREETEKDIKRRGER